jgi:hypothetical protein
LLALEIIKKEGGMPRTSPYRVILTEDEARILEQRARKYTLPYYAVVRAQMILLAAEGFSNKTIAARLNTRREVVSLWRKRFYYDRLEGLEGKPRPGRPRH